LKLRDGLAPPLRQSKRWHCDDDPGYATGIEVKGSMTITPKVLSVNGLRLSVRAAWEGRQRREITFVVEVRAPADSSHWLSGENVAWAAPRKIAALAYLTPPRRNAALAHRIGRNIPVLVRRSLE
jgi:hypothetical protein